MARRPFGMKATFILALVGFSAALSLGLAAVSAYRSAGDLREQLEQRGEGLTAHLAEEALRVLRIEDNLERELSLMLLTHRLVGEVVYAQVVYNGEVVSESKLHDRIRLERLADPANIPTVRQRDANGLLVMEFLHILPNTGGQSYVRLGLSLAEVQERVKRNLYDMAAMAALFTALGAGVAFGLYSAILKPLEHVMASIRRIQAGDLGARVRVSSYAELTELGEAFNRMAEVIGRRNEELQRVNAELRSASEAKSEFLAMIGHELKTPLHSVRGYCQILLEELDGPLTEEQRSDIEAVLASGNHLLALIDNILHFSASGTELLHVTEVDVADLVRQATDHVRPLAHRKHLALYVSTRTGPPARADATKLKQVLINLLHNAVNYTEKGSVAVLAQPLAQGYRIEVCDTGPGIPESERLRIFEPFERIHRAGREDHKGLGLGLAIARAYVHAHGGRIRVGEAPGGGARFTLFIPREPAISGERWRWPIEDPHRRRRPGSPAAAREVLDGERV